MVSIFFVFVSIVCFCLKTHPHLRVPDISVVEWRQQGSSIPYDTWAQEFSQNTTFLQNINSNLLKNQTNKKVFGQHRNQLQAGLLVVKNTTRFFFLKYNKISIVTNV